MSCRTTGTLLLNSLALLLPVIVGCSRDAAPGENRVLVYCTPGDKPFAAALRPALAGSTGAEVVLAPLNEADLLAALGAAPAGDWVVCAGQSLPKRLTESGFAAETRTLGTLRVAAATQTLGGVDTLAAAGTRIGFGKPGSALGDTASAALPATLREAVAGNITHRSDRSDELVRFLKLGALDVAFVWEGTALPDGVRTLALPETDASCPLVLVRLSPGRGKQARVSKAPAPTAESVAAALGPLGVRTGEATR